jgi:hypothetical protein
MVIGEDTQHRIGRCTASGDEQLRQAFQHGNFESVLNSLQQKGERWATEQGLEVFVMQSGGTHAGRDKQTDLHEDIT